MNYLNIVLTANDEKEYSLNDFKGKYIILYFYPKDNTEGCSLEAQEFTHYKDEFRSLSAEIIGISKDSVASHIKFTKKKELAILLLSDCDLLLQKQFEVWQLKKMCGKEYMGTVRSTFILNTKGEIIKEYRNVRVKNHVTNVLKDFKNLSGDE